MKLRVEDEVVQDEVVQDEVVQRLKISPSQASCLDDGYRNGLKALWDKLMV
jgi:hypothetical protein